MFTTLIFKRCKYEVVLYECELIYIASAPSFKAFFLYSTRFLIRTHTDVYKQALIHKSHPCSLKTFIRNQGAKSVIDPFRGHPKIRESTVSANRLEALRFDSFSLVMKNVRKGRERSRSL